MDDEVALAAGGIVLLDIRAQLGFLFALLGPQQRAHERATPLDLPR